MMDGSVATSRRKTSAGVIHPISMVTGPRAQTPVVRHLSFPGFASIALIRNKRSGSAEVRLIAGLSRGWCPERLIRSDFRRGRDIPAAGCAARVVLFSRFSSRSPIDESFWPSPPGLAEPSAACAFRPSSEQHDDDDDQKNGAEAATNIGAAKVETTAPKEKQ